jgi:DNA-binding NtrC family response regulator
MVEGQVLLVDDDPGQLRVRELILRNAGFIVHIATSAESAMALLRAVPEKIDVVVTEQSWFASCARNCRPCPCWC